MLGIGHSMDYKDIGFIRRGAFEPGKLRVQADGIAFKSSASGQVVQVKHSEIDIVEWMRVAKGYEIKVMSREGNVFKFDGFKESDYTDLKEFFKQHFGKDLKQVELCVKGWNWGEPVFKGSLLTFLVDSKPAFEIPLQEVSRVTSGKNEVALEFHQGETSAASLVEMRFHIPPSTGVDGEEDPVQSFHDRVLSKADVLQATGDAIASFAEMQCLTPRGRYNIRIYPTFLGAHGKTFDYKIPFTSIIRLFLLPHNDQRHVFFVLGLDPPIRQGQTRYPFFIIQMENDETCELTLAISEEELKEKYDNKMSQEMEGPLCEVFSRIMRAMVGRKITVPGSFKNINNQCAIACSCKATSGYLYPLDKGFIFVNKPAIFVKFEDISTVNFARMATSGASRSFDFEIETKDQTTYHFSSLMKDDYGRLSSFVSDKRLTVKNKVKSQVKYNDELSGNSSDEHDAYLARMKAEGEEANSSEDDSDFVVNEGRGNSDDDLEYDSDAKISLSEESGEEERPKPQKPKPQAKKRTKDSGKSRPAKKPKNEATPTATKGGKKKKDPNAPKKPLTPFFMWLGENRPAIKKKYPHLTVSEIGKKAGELWKTEVKDKSKYEEAYKKAQVEYKKKMAAYQAGGGGATSGGGGASSTAKIKKSPKKTGGNLKIKSTEYIDSDEDLSSEEERPTTKKKPSQSKRSTRSRGGRDEEMVSLDENDEASESEAELTNDDESDASND